MHDVPVRPHFVHTNFPTPKKTLAHFTLAPFYVSSAPNPHLISSSSPSTMSSSDNGRAYRYSDDWDAFLRIADGDEDELALRTALQRSRVDTSVSSSFALSHVTRRSADAGAGP